MSAISKNSNKGNINAGGSVFIGDNNDIKIQHILGNLQDYQNLEQEIEEAREVFNAIALDKQEIRLKLSGTIEAKKEKLENIKKAIEQAFEYISKLTISTYRLDQAKALFLEGDIPGALEILKDQAIQADYLALQTAKQSEEERHSSRMEEIAEKTKGIAEEWKMKAVLMATRYEDEDWFKKTKGYYEKVLQVDRNGENVFAYAHFLQKHNQYQEAAILYEQALQVYRTLAKSNPKTFLPDVAHTLNNLAVLSSAKNEVEKAQREYEEALEIRRTLAKINPEAFLPDLAITLNNLANLHHAKNELDQAQIKYEESLLIIQALASNNSQAFLPDLARTLNNLANLHRAKNEIEKAQVEYEESLSMYRTLAKSDSQAFQSDLAMTLNNLAVLYRTKNELDQAQAKYEESLAMYRTLAQSNPHAFQPDVAATLNNLANLHRAKNELEKAQVEYEESLAIYQSLAQSNSQSFLPYVAMTMVNMAEFYLDGQPDRERSVELVKKALRGAMPFREYLKLAQDVIKEAKKVIDKWGLDVEAFFKELE